MKSSVSNMLESTLIKLNQTYEIESIKTELKYTKDMIELDNSITFPVGSFIKISEARYNNGIFEVIKATGSGYKLDRKLIDGFETSVISPLNIPFGLLDIVRQMCTVADEGLDDGLKSLSIDEISLTFDEKSLFNKFSGMLSAYKKLKTI